MSNYPPLKKFSNEVPSKELLQLMLILYQITLDKEATELSRYLKHVSKVISPDDFNNLVRRVVRMMSYEKCGESLCSDWLMTNLYELYNSYGTEPEDSY